MKNEVKKFSGKSQADLVNEKLMYLTYQAELQRKIQDKCLEEDILLELSREMSQNV
jgi:hypothetical protein